MKRFIRSGTAVAGLVAAFTFASGASAAAYSPDQDFGSPGQGDRFDRVITIAPGAKWVNVDRNETVKIIDAPSGESFVWRFDTPAWMFPLNKAAPSGILSGRNIVVYVTHPNND
ncbi:MAG: CzcE family metal-binding protein [Burkholderiales bacterium]